MSATSTGADGYKTPGKTPKACETCKPGTCLHATGTDGFIATFARRADIALVSSDMIGKIDALARTRLQTETASEAYADCLEAALDLDIPLAHVTELFRRATRLYDDLHD